MQNYLEIYKKKIVSINGDGNCQFYSLYYGWCLLEGVKLGTGIKYTKGINKKKQLIFDKTKKRCFKSASIRLRAKLGWYIWRKEKRYYSFFAGSRYKFKLFCQNLVENNTNIWGNHMTLSAFSDLTGKRIRVFQIKMNQIILITPYDKINNKYETILPLKNIKPDENSIDIYYTGNHYNAIGDLK